MAPASVILWSRPAPSTPFLIIWTEHPPVQLSHEMLVGLSQTCAVADPHPTSNKSSAQPFRSPKFWKRTTNRKSLETCAGLSPTFLTVVSNKSQLFCKRMFLDVLLNFSNIRKWRFQFLAYALSATSLLAVMTKHKSQSRLALWTRWTAWLLTNRRPSEKKCAGRLAISPQAMRIKFKWRWKSD